MTIRAIRWGAWFLASQCLVACGGSTPPAETAEPSQDAYGEDTQANPESIAEPTHGEAAATEPAGATAVNDAPMADANGETRTIEAIAAFVKERREKVRPCYDAALKKDAKLKGDLAIRFVLDPAGKVKKAEYAKDQSSIVSDEAAACVITELSSWQFPASSRGMDSTVTYPFNFNPRR